ncbi:unnamed protein product, partial [Discosporangium mesarthrocarpum]
GSGSKGHSLTRSSGSSAARHASTEKGSKTQAAAEEQSAPPPGSVQGERREAAGPWGVTLSPLSDGGCGGTDGTGCWRKSTGGWRKGTGGWRKSTGGVGWLGGTNSSGLASAGQGWQDGMFLAGFSMGVQDDSEGGSDSSSILSRSDSSLSEDVVDGPLIGVEGVSPILGQKYSIRRKALQRRLARAMRKRRSRTQQGSSSSSGLPLPSPVV